MNLQSLKLKASTLCAGGTLLVFGGFLTVNLAGCGGGGGGLATVPTPVPLGVTFRLVQQDSTPSNGGTLTLTRDGQTISASADNNGVATIPNVPPGTYTATYTTFNSAGRPQASTSRQLIITRGGAQNYLLVQGDTGNGQFTLTGTILQNPNNNRFSGCGIDTTPPTTPITARLLISVRDLNDTTGNPIIAQIVRDVQSDSGPVNTRGGYSISIPTRPRTFRVEVSPAGNDGVIYAGISATTTFTQGNTSLANVNVCTNTDGNIPIPEQTPTPTPTPDIFGNTTGQTTTGTTTNGTTTNGTTTNGTTTNGTTTNGTTTNGTTTNGTTTNGTTTNGTTTDGTTTTGTTTNGTTTNGTTTNGTTTNGTTTNGTTTNGTTTNGTTTNGGANTAGTSTGGTAAGNPSVPTTDGGTQTNAPGGTNGSSTSGNTNGSSTVGGNGNTTNGSTTVVNGNGGTQGNNAGASTVGGLNRKKR